MSDDSPVAPSLIRQHISGCERRWSDQERRTRALEESMTEHRMRLENGTLAFQNLREDHTTMGSAFASKVAELTPKPPSVLKVVSIVMGVVSLGAGALWGLSTQLNDRPTTEQIHNIMESHQENGHKATRVELRELRDVQIEQKTSLDSLEDKVDKQDAKLDILIQQTQPTAERERNRQR